MEYIIERKISFIETSGIEADNLEDLKEKLKTTKLDWDVDFECDPVIESVKAWDEDEVDSFELPTDIMKEDNVEAENGCIIFNRKEFDHYHKWGIYD